MALSGLEEGLLLVGRILFGGVLAFMGLNHFLSLEDMTGYAEYKGLPAPSLAVIGGGIVLVAGGLSVVAGVYPAVGALALAAFLVVAALTMHDFWAQEGEAAETEMTQFLKNIALTGAALALVGLAGYEWAYSAGLSL